MKVQLKTIWASPEGIKRPGEIHEVKDDIAVDLVARGQAIAAPEDKRERAVASRVKESRCRE